MVEYGRVWYSIYGRVYEVKCYWTLPPQVSVEVSQRRHDNKEAELMEEEGRLQQQLAEEELVSQRIEQYLQKHYEVRNISLQYSSTTYEH